MATTAAPELPPSLAYRMVGNWDSSSPQYSYGHHDGSYYTYQQTHQPVYLRPSSCNQSHRGTNSPGMQASYFAPYPATPQASNEHAQNQQRLSGSRSFDHSSPRTVYNSQSSMNAGPTITQNGATYVPNSTNPQAYTLAAPSSLSHQQQIGLPAYPPTPQQQQQQPQDSTFALPPMTATAILSPTAIRPPSSHVSRHSAVHLPASSASQQPATYSSHPATMQMEPPRNPAPQRPALTHLQTAPSSLVDHLGISINHQQQQSQPDHTSPHVSPTHGRGDAIFYHTIPPPQPYAQQQHSMQPMQGVVSQASNPPTTWSSAAAPQAEANVLDNVLDVIKAAATNSSMNAISPHERLEKTQQLDQAYGELRRSMLSGAPSKDVNGGGSMTGEYLQSTPTPKGDRKRMYPEEEELEASQAKRSESFRLSQSTARAPPATQQPAVEHLSMPPLIHTNSAPVIMPQSHYQANSTAMHNQPFSSTPATDATVAGVHLALQPPSVTQSFPPPLQAPIALMPVQHVPHTPSPLANAIAAPTSVAFDAMMRSAPPTPLMQAPPMLTPAELRMPSTEHLQSPFASFDRFPPNPDTSGDSMLQQNNSIEEDEKDASMRRQPPNPRLFGHVPSAMSRSLSSGTSSAFENTTRPPSRHHVQHASWAGEDFDAVHFHPSLPGSPDETEASSSRIRRKRSYTTGGMSQRPTGAVSPPFSPMLEEGTGLASGAITPELKERMDAVFTEWLQQLCNDLDATDSKGELIHQTLMAKKMQRLDESGEFRPFKFRIQAFTNRFNEELIRRGLRDTEVPNKLVRQYLWNQTLISRFNEEGKKAKSKGNHVWSIDAKRTGEHSWIFRPFERRIIPPQSKVLRRGQQWTYSPRLWDPQGANIKATYSSPILPTWLSWKPASGETSAELSGTPPLPIMGEFALDEAQQIPVIADFTVDGQATQLELVFELLITSPTPSNAGSSSQAPIASSAPDLVPLATPAAHVLTSASISQNPLDGNVGLSLPMDYQLPAAIMHSALGISSDDVDIPIGLQTSGGLPPSGSGFPPPALSQLPLDQAGITAQAEAAISSMLMPQNLVAAEQAIHSADAPGPLTAALQHRDEQVLAFTVAALPGLTADPNVLADLHQSATLAQEAADQAISQAQNDVLQNILASPGAAGLPNNDASNVFFQ